MAGGLSIYRTQQRIGEKQGYAEDDVEIKDTEQQN